MTKTIAPVTRDSQLLRSIRFQLLQAEMAASPKKAAQKTTLFIDDKTLRFSLIVKTGNVKTGAMPASYQTKATCPTSCPFMDKECYAEFGGVSWHWKKVTAGLRGVSWPEFLAKVEQLPPLVMWRYGVAGDLPGYGDVLDTVALAQLVKANAGKNGYCYTHKVLRSQGEKNAVAAACASGFMINLSANNLEHADQRYALGIAPVVVVVPNFEEMPKTTPNGVPLVACPAQTRDITCEQCGLCQKWRNSIVAFAAHGAKAKDITWD